MTRRCVYDAARSVMPHLREPDLGERAAAEMIEKPDRLPGDECDVLPCEEFAVLRRVVVRDLGATFAVVEKVVRRDVVGRLAARHAAAFGSSQKNSSPQITQIKNGSNKSIVTRDALYGHT